jgi:hypothetical protein
LIRRIVNIIYIREWRQILGKIQESVENRKKESTPVQKRRSTGSRKIEEDPKSTKRKIRIKKSINLKVDRIITRKSADKKKRREGRKTRKIEMNVKKAKMIEKTETKEKTEMNLRIANRVNKNSSTKIEKKERVDNKGD